MMKVVINIQEDVYTRLFDSGIQDNEISLDDVCEMAKSIRLGTPEQKKPCDDCISREEATKPFLVDATEEWTSADIVKYLKSLLSVMPTMRYPQVPGITPIVVPVEEESEDIRYDSETTLNKGWRRE